ncbi:g5261 [Coccomyxa elongata]
MASKVWMGLMLATAIFAFGAPAALADCSDRTYNCILSADVSYDSSTNQATTVTGGCSSGGGSTDSSGGGTDSSGDGTASSDGTDSSDGLDNLAATGSSTPSCNVGGSDTSGSSTQFLAKGTSAGTITQGRCFQLFSGCLPNNCGGSQKPEDICNSNHPQCANSCTVVCTDACSNT